MIAFLKDINWISVFGIVVTNAGFISGCFTIAQSEELDSRKKAELSLPDNVSLSGFIDTAFSYDFNNFQPRNRSYLTQPTRDREYHINLAYFDTKLDSENYRGRLAVQAGNSVDTNYAAEKNYGIRYIQESTAGLKLAEGLWLDGGIYLSHIGFEGWISRDNWSYTRLLMSEFSPYYESGVKLSYAATENLNLQFHYLNGWQNISNFDGRSAIGTQVAYTFDNKASIISNGFVGDEDGTRLFHDLIFKLPPIERLELAVAFDVGSQQRIYAGSAQWYTWGLLSRYSINDSLRLNFRAEQFLDDKNVLAATPNEEPFKTIGFSVGFDYELYKNLWWRNEYRTFIAENPIFRANYNGVKSTDHFVVSSLSYTF
jgi:hypothetical protein